MHSLPPFSLLYLAVRKFVLVLVLVLEGASPQQFVVEPNIVGIAFGLFKMVFGKLPARQQEVVAAKAAYLANGTEQSVDVALFHHASRGGSDRLRASAGAVSDNGSATSNGFEVYRGVVVLPRGIDLRTNAYPPIR